MYTAIAIVNGEKVTITAPSVDTLYNITFAMNYDVFVNGVQIKAKDGQLAGCKGYFAGVTKSYLKVICEKGVE